MDDEDRDRAEDHIEQSRPTRPSNRMLAALIIAAAVLIFIFFNRQDTRISFVFFHAEASLWVALALAAGGGFVAGFLIGRKRYKA